MSTVDPRVARLQREQQSGGRSLVLTIVLGIVHLGLWTLAGYGFGQLFDAFRLMSINQVGDGWTSPYEGVPLLFLLGVIIGAILGFLLTSVARRVLGIGAATVLPLVTGTAGIAIGLAIFFPSWTPPQSYGELLPFLSGDAEPWGVGAWIFYWVPVWLPIAFGVISVILLIVMIALAIRGRRKAERMVSAIQEGRRVTGDVSEVRSTGTEINGMPYLHVTVHFRDDLGTDRWVTKKSTFPPGSVPRAGDPAAVWFDPMNRDDQKRIVIGLGPEAAQAPSS